MPAISRRELIRTGVGLGLFSAGSTWAADDSTITGSATEFSFHRDHILGTSLDLWLRCSTPHDANAIEEAILSEIDRLRAIFSTYDGESELSRLNRSNGPTNVSADLMQVLVEAIKWRDCTGGAFNAESGALIELWKEAQRTGRQPDGRDLKRLSLALGEPGWRIDALRHTVERIADRPLNLNSSAKGYIIEKAVAAAMQKVPQIEALLLDLGGDLYALGDWIVGVQNPLRPEENSPPLTLLRLKDQAVATSGGYQRYWLADGVRHSHLLDPRTGEAANRIASATVVAMNNRVANVLATTLCVLSPAEGLRLIGMLPGTESLIVAADGTEFRSAGFADFEIARVAAADEEKEAKTAWPNGFQVTINLELPKPGGNKPRRPYVAVWIEDGDGKLIRTVAVWGNNNRWVPDLKSWWKLAKGDAALVKSITKATRAPGKYEVVWDGKNDKGDPVPQGTYTIRIEVHREHGKDVVQTGKLDCLDKAATLNLEKNAETEATSIDYGKKKK